jgi:hypothetical protein
MTDSESFTGSIGGIRDCGTLVLVFLDTDDERTIPIPMERRAFHWLLDGEGFQPDELVGRRISYDGEHILFLDRECSR